MSLLAPLPYIAALLRYRDSAPVVSYLRAGLGIEIRSRKLAVHWRPHQDASRTAQRNWQAQGKRLAVLGAGRLLDFEDTGRFQTLRFVDADPLCQRYWRKAHPDHEAVITDISGCLADWTSHLPTTTDWVQTLDHIRSQRAIPRPCDFVQECDAVLSLNLLSQIPIVWEERVESYLCGRFGSSFVLEREQEWLTAVEPSCRSLVDAHLAMLDASGAQNILIITDLMYLDYKGSRKFSRRRLDPPPVSWQNGQWSSDDPAIECTSSSALYGLTAPVLQRYHGLWPEEWLWHISPQGTEGWKGGGSVHLVGAFGFELR